MPTDAQHTKAHPKQKSPPSLINPLLISSIALRAAHAPSLHAAKKGPGHSRQQVVRGWRSAPILEQHTIELEHAEILLLIVKVVVFFVSTSARLAHRDAVLVPRAGACGKFSRRGEKQRPSACEILAC